VELFLWKFLDPGVNPPLLRKKRIIEEYANSYNINVLVETGTYYGDMVDALKNQFDRIYSIELDSRLYTVARWRFDSKHHHINLLNGDSGRLLEHTALGLEEPCIYWLDAHYSGGVTARGDTDTPIIGELGQLSKSPHRNIILIDDARQFGIIQSYPTISELFAYVSKNFKNATVTMEQDIVRIIT